MCGIVGLIVKGKQTLPYNSRDMFENLLILDQVRGMDGTGMFGVFPNQQASLLKCGTNASNLIGLADFDKFATKISNFKFLVGHNRKATQGSISTKNSHPFYEDNIVLVHNGTLHNWRELDKDADVDSQAVARALNKDTPENVLKGINGAYAFVWFDKRDKLFRLVRNDERPLFLAEMEDMWAFASEPWMITSAAMRNRLKIIDIQLIPEYELLEFKSGVEYNSKHVQKYTYVQPTYRHQHGFPHTTPQRGQISPHMEHDFWENQLAHMSDIASDCCVPPFPKLEDKTKEAAANDEDGTAEIEFTLEPRESVDDKLLNSFIKTTTEVAFKIESMKVIKRKNPEKPDAPEQDVVEVLGTLPYFKSHPRIDVRAVVGWTGDPSKVHEASFADIHGNRWLQGLVKASGNNNCGPWITMNTVYPPSNVKLWNKHEIPFPFWDNVCKNYTCDSCKRAIKSSEAPFTSVKTRSRDGSVFKVTCADCVTEALPEDKQNEVLQARIDALPFGKPVSDGSSSTVH